MENKHERLIVKVKGEALGYTDGNQNGANYVLRHSNGDRVKTIVTNDKFIEVANINIKVKIYADGRLEVGSHQLKGREKL